MSELVAYFQTASGAGLVGPAGGDIPEIRIATSPGDVLTQAPVDMTELTNAPGWYAFTFAPVDGTEYVWIADGDPAASGQVPATGRFVRGVISGTTVARHEVDVSAILVDTAAMQPFVDVAISSRESEAAADARETTNTAEHTATLTAVGLNESEADALIRAIANIAEHDVTQAALALVAADVTTLEIRTTDLVAALAFFGAIIGTPVTHTPTTVTAGGFTWTVVVAGPSTTFARVT